MIFMVLLQISCAVNISNPIFCDQYNEILDWAQWPDLECQELPRCLNLSSSFEACKNCGGKIIGHDNLMTICIPSFFKQTLTHPPYKRVPMIDGKWNSPLTDIGIRMRDVQVINIGTDTITIDMNFEVHWFDYRLQNWNYSPKEYWTWIFLSMELRNLIWFPDIIVNNLVSEKEIDKKIILLRIENNPIPLVVSQFYLSTTVKCQMDFQNYPFDKHVCILEVCSIQNFYLIPIHSMT